MCVCVLGMEAGKKDEGNVCSRGRDEETKCEVRQERGRVEERQNMP